MKTKLLAVYLALVLPEAVAAPFRNLDFEEADLSRLTTDANGFVIGTTEALLPGWTLSLGSTVISNVVFGRAVFGGGLITNGTGGLQVHSRYALLVQNNGYSPDFPELPYTRELSQIGEIPVGARELWYTGLINAPGLYLNGEPAPVITGDGLERSYNIEAFAGQTVELRFLLENTHDVPITYGIDNIRFIPIPEPRSLLLWAVAVVAGCVMGVTSRRRASAR